jgi:hypothetical protein
MVLKRRKNMRKTLTTFLGAALMLVALAAVAVSQVQTTTVTKVQTVQNPDGTYTIVEYPVGKETTVILNPVGITGATARGTIIRDDNGTTIKLNLASLPADLTGLNIYAVDPTGAVTMLGPVEIANGVGTFTTTTPLNRFMLIASPDASLTAYNPNTKIFFRSAVPTGFTVIPLGQGVAVGEAVGAAASLGDYAVPMLGIPTFKVGDDTKLKINFTGAMEGARANVFIEPHKNGKMTEVRMRFHDLKEAPKGTSYVLWAVSPDNQYQRLGQIVNFKGRNEAEIKSETAFDDFGLLLTTEDAALTTGTIIRPAGHRVGVIEIIR